MKCPTFVRSRQSTQLTRSTPRCRRTVGTDAGGALPALSCWSAGLAAAAAPPPIAVLLNIASAGEWLVPESLEAVRSRPRSADRAAADATSTGTSAPEICTDSSACILQRSACTFATGWPAPFLACTQQVSTTLPHTASTTTHRCCFGRHSTPIPPEQVHKCVTRRAANSIPLPQPRGNPCELTHSHPYSTAKPTAHSPHTRTFFGACTSTVKYEPAHQSYMRDPSSQTRYAVAQSRG